MPDTMLGLVRPYSIVWTEDREFAYVAELIKDAMTGDMLSGGTRTRSTDEVFRLLKQNYNFIVGLYITEQLSEISNHFQNLLAEAAQQTVHLAQIEANTTP